MKQTQRKQAIFILIACCFMILTILSCFGNEVLASSDRSEERRVGKECSLLC